MPYFLQTVLTTSATNSFPLSDWSILGSGAFFAENILVNALAIPVAFLFFNGITKAYLLKTSMIVSPFATFETFLQLPPLYSGTEIYRLAEMF